MTDGRLPDYLVIGAAKAGTTSLAYYLAAHPAIFMAKEKEVHYFDRDHHYALGPDWYARHFAAAPAETLAGEASPSYMYVPQAPQRMAALVPDAKLIALLREPVDRAYSHYWSRRSWDAEARSFEQALAEEDGSTPPGLAYAARGRYLEQLERVLQHYPREQLLVLLFDDLAARPIETFAEVCRFLSADDTVRPEIVGNRFNVNHRRRSSRLRRAMERTRAWRWAPTLADRVDAWNNVPVNYPKLEPQRRDALRELFVDDNLRLAAWLGRDLSAWLPSARTTALPAEAGDAEPSSQA